VSGEEEQRIRERAYFIWEKEGRPQGRELDHRLRAEAEIAAERLRDGKTATRSRPGRDTHANDKRLVNARQAAEALFMPNRAARMGERGAACVTKTARRPRVLPASPTAPNDHEGAGTPTNSKHATEIARSQFARIRTWIRFGMTARQVADLYGVEVGEIERILRRR
jgi:hypothetical protein